jgi:iron complex outermembrane receptor protein
LETAFDAPDLVVKGLDLQASLNNADPNGFAYQGFSSYLTADLRLRWKITQQWSAAVGIDNLNNQTYWNFHPYPQRTYNAELRFDL